MKKLIAVLSVVSALAGGWFVRQPIMTASAVATMALLLEANPALAANCSAFTYTLTNGTTADANQVMSNFNTLLNCANNNLAHNGANSDITSLSGLTTPLPVPQGGTGLGTLTSGAFVIGNGTGTPTSLAVFYPQPQGRLTLSTGKPVMTADVTAATTIYYDTYVGSSVLVNGAILTIGANEISMGLDAVTPHIASGSLYDVFGISNSGTLAICAGPAWTNSTTRSAAIALSNGVRTNSGSLTHCWGGASGTTDYGAVGANAGTYLGTFYATANGQTGVQFAPAAAVGGSGTIVGLFNAYNRLPIKTRSQDSRTTAYNYGTLTWRAMDASTANSIKFVDGLAVIAPAFSNAASVDATTNTGLVGVMMNWSSGAPTFIANGGVTGGNITVVHGNSPPALGLNTISALESPISAANSTYSMMLATGTVQVQNLEASFEM